MKKTISYKLGYPQAGVKGSENSLPMFSNNTQAVDGKFLIPYANPFIEARCVYLSRLGAVVALATPKPSGTDIEYRTLIAPALLSQSWQLSGAYTKLFDATGNPELAEFLGGVDEPFYIMNAGGNNKSQSVYNKAAFALNESLSEAMASDTSELIEFSYKVDYDPEILSRYITQNGTTHPTRNGEFFNPYLGALPSQMAPLWTADLGNAIESRPTEVNKSQKVDGSFIAFWPTDIEDMTSSSYGYTASGLSNLVEDGIQTLEVVRDQQNEIWAQAYQYAE